MPTQPKSSGIRDNHYCGSVGDFLKPYIQDKSRLSVVSAYFTIYAYEALKDWLDRIEHMNFLFGEPTFVKSLDPSKTETKAFVISQDGLKLANALQQKRVARECADWIPDASKYLLGILNSSVVLWLFCHLLAKLQNDFYEPSSVFMKDFPIPSEADKNPIEKLVERILGAIGSDPFSDVSKWEREIDERVYRLYGLMKDEIKIVEDSTVR